MWADVIKIILDFGNKKNEIEQARRLRMSEIFLEISDLLNGTAESLEDNIYPLGSCFKMTALAEELLLALQDKMDSETWHKLSGLLYESCKLEKEYANREDKDIIEKLRETSAYFYAQSAIYKL